MPALRAQFAANPRLAKAKAYPDYRALLAREKLDLVAINNSNGARAAAILASVDRGLDVLAERPLALTRPDLEKVKRAVAASKVALGALFPMRFGAPYQAIKRVVAAGDIGQVLQMSAQKSYQIKTRASWFLKRESYGSSISWIGIHLIDLMRWTSGREIRQVTGFHTRPGLPGMGEMDAVSGSLFKLDNGGVATMHLDYLRPKKAPSHGDDRLRLIGTQGVVEYQAATGVTVITNDRPPTPIDPLPQARIAVRRLPGGHLQRQALRPAARRHLPGQRPHPRPRARHRRGPDPQGLTGGIQSSPPCIQGMRAANQSFRIRTSLACEPPLGRYSVHLAKWRAEASLTSAANMSISLWMFATEKVPSAAESSAKRLW